MRGLAQLAIAANVDTALVAPTPMLRAYLKVRHLLHGQLTDSSGHPEFVHRKIRGEDSYRIQVIPPQSHNFTHQVAGKGDEIACFGRGHCEYVPARASKAELDPRQLV